MRLPLPFGTMDEAGLQRVEAFRRWAFILLVVPHLIPSVWRLDDPIPARRAAHLVIAALMATASFAVLRVTFGALDAATQRVESGEQRRRRVVFEVVIPLACVVALWCAATWAVAVAVAAS